MKKIVYLACIATCGLCVENSFGGGFWTQWQRRGAPAPVAQPAPVAAAAAAVQQPAAAPVAQQPAPAAVVQQPTPIPQQDPQSTSAIAQEENEIAELKAENETLRAEIAELERKLAEKSNTNGPIWSNSNTPEE